MIPGTFRCRHGRPAWVVWSIATTGIPFAAIAAVGAFEFGSRVWSALGILSRPEFQAKVLILQSALTVVVAPLAGVAVVSRAQTSTDLNQQREHFLEDVVATLTVGAAALAMTSAILGLGLRGAVDIPTLLASHAVLWAGSLMMAALGAFCASRLADPLDAAASAAGLAVMSAAAVFVAGPILSSVPSTVLSAALMGSPIAATALAANLDIFHGDVLYRVSPLAHMRVDYPTVSTTLVSYLAIALVLFTGTIRQPLRRTRFSSAERTSA